jgi:CubicO group peptidase (beta-lactamase class C family)
MSSRSGMNRRAFLGGTALGGLALSGCGSATSTSSPAFSGEGLAHMHDLMAGYVDRGVIPGMVTLVSRLGEVHADAIGVQGIGGAPMRRDTIFRIASMTKPVTAVATLILVEEGKLSLDAPVDRWLPELANRQVLRALDGQLGDTVPSQRPITVRDLLTLTMGTGLLFPIEAYPVLKAAVDLKLGDVPPHPLAPPAPDEWMRRFSTLPLMSQPGERWLYNTAFDVLGVLIARASGQTFDAFLSERIFSPLGMRDTAFAVAAAATERLATCYFADEGGTLQVYDDPTKSEWSSPPAFPSGAGGLVSTVDDFHAFAAMLLAHGQYPGGRILTTSSVQSMTTDHLTPAQKAISGLAPGFFDTQGWGFGVAVNTAPDAVSARPGRYGWDGGFGTYWISDPIQDLVAIVLTQRPIDASSPELDFWKAAYQAIPS